MNEHDADNQPAENQLERRTADASGQSSGVLVQASWRGPLPPPNILGRYDEVLPGAAERILVMSENLHQHELNMERDASDRENKVLDLADKALSNDASQGRRGQWFAFVIALLGIVVGALLIAIDKAGFGMAVIFTPLAGLVGVFVYGTQARSAERRRNAGRGAPEEE